MTSQVYHVKTEYECIMVTLQSESESWSESWSENEIKVKVKMKMKVKMKNLYWVVPKYVEELGDKNNR